MADLWAVNSEHSYISITYVEEQDYFYVKWNGHINSDDVVLGAETYLRLQQEKRCPRLLNDKSEVTGDWIEANDWLEYDWMPKSTEAGLRYFAMVLPHALYSLATAQDLQNRLSTFMEVAMFRDLTSAQEWITTRPVL